LRGRGLSYEEKVFGKDFNTPEELYEAVGKQVRTMPQIQIDNELIGGYNQLVEHFMNQGKVNFKGEKI
jgi:glutaredoxin